MLSISFLCLFLGISKSGHYSWLKREEIPKYNAYLLKCIRELFNKYKSKFGVRRIHIYLQREYGIRINVKTVHRYMKHLNLKSKIRRAKKRTESKDTKNGWNDLIKRNFNSKLPEEKLFTDVTYIRTYQGWAYLSVVLDTYNNAIVDWKISFNNNDQLMHTNIEEALKKIKNVPILHSDHASSYSNKGYKELQTKYSFKPSMGRVGNSLDNRPVEYFFSILKQEWLSDIPLKHRTFTNLEKEISKFMIYYHDERIQTNLNNKTPSEYLML